MKTNGTRETFGIICCMVAAAYLGMSCGGGPIGAVMAVFLVGHLALK